MSKIRVWAAFVLAVIVGGHGARAQTPIPPSPKDFVMAASQSNQYEILAARVASVQSQDPRVRTFAQKMIQEHTRLSQDLRNAAVASGLPAPDSGMSSDQAMLLSGLQVFGAGISTRPMLVSRNWRTRKPSQSWRALRRRDRIRTFERRRNPLCLLSGNT